MAHLTNFSFEFFYEFFTEDVSLRLLYYGAKKSKMTKNSNQGVLPSTGINLFSLPYCHRNCKVEELVSQSEDLRKKERRKEKRSQRHEQCLADRSRFCRKKV